MQKKAEESVSFSACVLAELEIKPQSDYYVMIHSLIEKLCAVEEMKRKFLHDYVLFVFDEDQVTRLRYQQNRFEGEIVKMLNADVVVHVFLGNCTR